MEKLTKFGKFGNANVYYTNDWLDVTIDEDFDRLGASQLSIDDKCLIYSRVELEFVYSEMGFEFQPQPVV